MLMSFDFYFYIYPPDLQESNRGTIYRASFYFYLLLEMPIQGVHKVSLQFKKIITK